MHGGELDGTRPVGFGQPDFRFARAIRLKGDPSAVGENLGSLSALVEEMETTGGATAGPPGVATSTRQIFQSAKLLT